ncbi:glycerate kinase [Christensenellaceae bacterium OttesenSCG-928-L17]|nr:glycerate kinase [Christensenellaceae bacterium OttesenSCG-928-L17]
MQSILLAFDSFKGTLSAPELCNIATQALEKTLPGVVIEALPLADGGEGMVDAYLRAAGGTAHVAEVSGPFLEPVRAKYGILNDGTAILEMAACAGLPLVGERKNPLRASTYGLGELILHAHAQGAEKLIVGLGGSATNDGGIGMAAALGYRFFDRRGEEVAPFAENMTSIEHIEKPATLPRISVVAACDVDNLLYGPTGATYTFSKQKGADADMMRRLEAGIIQLSEVMLRDLGCFITCTPGAGAAGGLGAAVVAFLSGSLQPGIELLLNAANFDDMVRRADLVITGEGRIDYQTAHGKAPAGVARRAKQYHKPCIALCGATGENVQDVYACGIDAVFSSVACARTWEDVQQTAAQDFALLVENIGRLLLLTQKLPQK